MCSVAQSCSALCDPMGCSLPGSSVHGIFQVRILCWIAISYSRRSSQPRDQTRVSCIGRWILYHSTTWKAQYIYICLYWNKLFFSFKAFIAIYYFLFLFVFICLMLEERRKGKRKRAKESRHELLRTAAGKSNQLRIFWGINLGADLKGNGINWAKWAGGRSG